MKTISTISVVDGHDSSNQSKVEILLVCFTGAPKGFSGGRYFGLPAGIPKAAFDGRPCCINTVATMKGGGLRLTPISGGGPDVNIHGSCKIVMDPPAYDEAGTARQDGKVVTSGMEFDFYTIWPEEVKGLEMLWKAQQEANNPSV